MATINTGDYVAVKEESGFVQLIGGIYKVLSIDDNGIATIEIISHPIIEEMEDGIGVFTLPVDLLNELTEEQLKEAQDADPNYSAVEYDENGNLIPENEEFHFTGGIILKHDRDVYQHNVSVGLISNPSIMITESNSEMINAMKILMKYARAEMYGREGDILNMAFILSEITEEEFDLVDGFLAAIDFELICDILIERFTHLGAGKSELSLRFIDTLKRKRFGEYWDCPLMPENYLEITDWEDYFKSYYLLQGRRDVDEAELNRFLNTTDIKSVLALLDIMPFTNTPVNKRLKIYYGDPGAGKTYEALIESEGLVKICSVSELPEDVLRTFEFNATGDPVFCPSIVAKCMTDGKLLTVDEFNLNTTEVHEFWQAILDNKDHFTFRGEDYEIADGFSIIATMNLYKDGIVRPLPEAIVDRAYEIKEFVLTGDDVKNRLYEDVFIYDDDDDDDDNDEDVTSSAD